MDLSEVSGRIEAKHSHARRGSVAMRFACAMSATFAAALVTLGCSAGGEAASDEPRNGVAQQREETAQRSPLFAIAENALFELDPVSLEPLRGPRVPLKGRTAAPSFSPDGTMLALGARGSPWVRFIDLDRMRVAGDMRLPRRGSVDLTAWLSDRRVLVVATLPGCCPAEAVFSVVDPFSERVVAEGKLGGSLQGAEPWGRRGWVFLVGPPRSVGEADIVIVEPDGRVRGVDLRIPAGNRPPRSSEDRGEEHHPDLAVDPARARAFVVGRGAGVAEVNLATLGVAYHEPREDVSFLGRVRDWVEPKAWADIIGPETVRKAVWVGGARIAVSGWNTVLEGGKAIQRPIGLRIVDTRTWLQRMLDQRVRSFAFAAATLLASDTRLYGGQALGLVGYSSEGNRRFHLFGEREVGPALILGERAYVTGRWSGRHADVVDIRSGRVVGRAELPEAVVLDPSAPHSGCSWPC